LPDWGFSERCGLVNRRVGKKGEHKNEQSRHCYEYVADIPGSNTEALTNVKVARSWVRKNAAIGSVIFATLNCPLLTQWRM